MNGEILLELNDLLQAERELSGLLASMRTDVQEARTLYDRLHDWKGHSANVVRNQIETFFEDMSRRIYEIEQQKLELVRYVQHMRQVDGIS
ncbi:hypothetical protein SAMN05661091_1229 [Paenibacillus uliginis N3/975]|uniref:WXG100 family type VII secretion target n=1 Tax=Paenibacillus uliginis N3/975 TaxID=1313296 RepID=A0A1X7GX57_9BACL|nr:hypothetical protein [Paenibacillus uliginis]SMF75619.1 hypothetical protein SAMN05661091_1229 [Paenibacillus uliginis N3/975]